MPRTQKHFTFLAAGIWLAIASGCAPSTPLTVSSLLSSLSPAPLASDNGPLTHPPSVPVETPQTPDAETITISLYYPDSNCEALVPESVGVSKAQALEAAVGRAIEKAESGDFDLTGYRTSVNNGVATIDLRLSPESPRHFLSMSACEQFALFGSLRKTLLDNPQLQVTAVRFTENDQELLF